MNAKQVRLSAIIFSLAASIIILSIKFYAAKISDSAALRSDALEGMVNVLAAVFGLGAIIFSEKPADKDHPYGHGKIEYFSAVFEGGLISLAGFLILLDAASRLIHPHPLDDLSNGLKINILAGALNGAIGIGLYLIGKKYKSEVLRADGIHLLTDLMTTFGLALGLVLVIFTGWLWLDAVLALMVALFLFRTGFTLVKSSTNALLDAEDPEYLKKVTQQLNTLPRGQIITFHELKSQQFGRDKHIDLHIVVPEYIPIKEAHELCDNYSIKLHQALGENCMIHSHIDPCHRLYCQQCLAQNCPVRQAPFKEQPAITVEDAIKKDLN